MRRTNIYLTEGRHRLIGQRVQVESTTMLDIVRRLLDRALGIASDESSVGDALAATFGMWADRSDAGSDEILAWRRTDRFDRLGL